MLEEEALAVVDDEDEGDVYPMVRVGKEMDVGLDVVIASTVVEFKPEVDGYTSGVERDEDEDTVLGVGYGIGLVASIVVDEEDVLKPVGIVGEEPMDVGGGISTEVANKR